MKISRLETSEDVLFGLDDGTGANRQAELMLSKNWRAGSAYAAAIIDGRRNRPRCVASAAGRRMFSANMEVV